MKQKQTMSKSEKRRIAIMKKEAKSEPVNETESGKVWLIAKQDTQLADGKFIGRGSAVEVDASYAERVLAEKETHFVKK